MVFFVCYVAGFVLFHAKQVPGGTRTRNLCLRRATPYPLGHRDRLGTMTRLVQHAHTHTFSYRLRKRKRERELMFFHRPVVWLSKCQNLKVSSGVRRSFFQFRLFTGCLPFLQISGIHSKICERFDKQPRFSAFHFE